MTKDNYDTPEGLDDIMSKVDLNEKTELGEVAENVFRSSPSRSNISSDEHVLCWINQEIFNGLIKKKGEFKDLNPVKSFLELKKSVNGWSTEKFVQSTAGVNDQRSGGLLGSIKNSLFTPRQ